jgi:hypothetical protein
MSYTVTFDVKDDKSNVLGCDALLDEFTTAEFETGTLTDVEAAANELSLENSLPPQDFTDYDTTGSGFSVSADTITLSNFETRNQTAYVVDDFGVDYFDYNFEIYFDVNWTASDSWAYCSICVLSNTLGSYQDTVDASGYALGLRIRTDGSGNRQYILYEVDGGVHSQDYSTLALGHYYFKFTRTATHAYLYIYSDSTRETLSDTLSLELTNYKSYRYLYGLQSTDNTTNSHQISATINNLCSLYPSSGNRVSEATDVGSFGSGSHDLTIKWQATTPADTTLKIETGTSDSDSTPPSTWYEQSNGESISDLPADLTGKYLWYKATLSTTDDTVAPELEWICIYDADDSPYAAVRVDFNDEIKEVDSSGTVDFTAVDVGNDQPYTAYILPLETPYWGEDFTEEGTVDVVDANVTEYITAAIPAARVTQQYIEVAAIPEPPNARVTQQYIEVAAIPAPPSARVTQQYIEVAYTGTPEPSFSTYDTIEITESVSADIEAQAFLGINTYDTATITEYITASVISLGLEISTYETTTVAESTTSSILIGINTYSSISTAEDVSCLLSSFISVSDTVGSTESVTSRVDLNSVVNDSVDITEDITSVIALAVVSVFDEATISEDFTVDILESGALSLSVFDTIEAEESYSLGFISYISIFDTVELESYTPAALSDLSASTEDETTADENISSNLVSFISTEDEVSITEDSIIGLEIDTIIYDEVSLEEEITREMTSFVEKYEEVSTTENTGIGFESFVTTYDECSTAESISLAFSLTASVIDTVNATEDIVSAAGTCPATVYDEVSISESVDANFLLVTISLSVYSTITVDETITAVTSGLVRSIFDSISTDEYLSLENQLAGVSVSDSITIAELVERNLLSFISIHDTTSVDEDVTAGGLQLLPYVEDSVGITEDIQRYILVEINTFTSVSVGSYLTGMDIAEFLDITAVEVVSAAEVVEVFTHGKTWEVLVYTEVNVSEYILTQLRTPAYNEMLCVAAGKSYSMTGRGINPVITSATGENLLTVEARGL